MEDQPVQQYAQPQPSLPVQPASPAPSPQPPSPQPPTSSCNYPAIVGFILSLSPINILGLIFSIIGLSQAKRTGGEGQGYALAGLIISIFSIVVSLWILIVFVIATDRLADEFKNLNSSDGSSIIENYKDVIAD